MTTPNNTPDSSAQDSAPSTSAQDSTPSSSTQSAPPTRTPSMIASLFVMGTMVFLIILAVILFGSDVAEGPLQVSMTIALLVAVSVAYGYGFRSALIGQAIQKSVTGTIGTIFVLLAIGAVIGTLYLSGTVAAFVYYGVDIVSARFYYITVFAIASALSIVLGSSFTTVGAVGVAFVGLASLMGVSPAITAGAAISGAMLGDKTAKISDTATLTVATVGGVSLNDHIRSVRRTAIPTVIISAVLFLILGLMHGGSAQQVDAAQVQDTLSQFFNVSFLAFLPIVLIFVLSALHFSGFLCLMIPAILAVVLAGFTQHDLIVSMASDPSLGYIQSVITVGIDVLANGFQLGSGNEQLDQLFAGGGTAGMLSTIWLILIAAAFGAVTDYTGMLHRIITPVIKWTKGAASLVLATILTSLGLNTVAADPYVSIVMSARMYRGEYMKERIQPVVLSTAIADSGTIFSAIVPWNVNGAFFAASMGVTAVAYAPFAFLCYLSPIITTGISFVRARRDKIPMDSDADAVYGKEPAELPELTQTA